MKSAPVRSMDAVVPSQPATQHWPVPLLSSPCLEDFTFIDTCASAAACRPHCCHFPRLLCSRFSHQVFAPYANFIRAEFTVWAKVKHTAAEEGPWLYLALDLGNEHTFLESRPPDQPSRQLNQLEGARIEASLLKPEPLGHGKA